jgi:hypothetical protein
VGSRGLPGGDTLPRLLARERGRRHPGELPRLTERKVAAWAQAHRDRTGRWPNANSGPVEGAPGESWSAVAGALQQGGRGLPRGSLPRLLAGRCGARNRTSLPRLTEGRVLRWADAHRRRTGRWPHADSGPVAGVPGQTWQGVNKALVQGLRGLPGGSSLARLLAERRGKRNQAEAPRLREGQILRWADRHRRCTGRWPNPASGPVQDAPGESWGALASALWAGHRGLPGGSTLAQLLAERRRDRNPPRLPRLNAATILAWADAHRRRTGEWPGRRSGPVAEAPGETWFRVDVALRLGLRGLPSGDTLLRLLRRSGHNVPERRGRPCKAPGPPC